MIKQTRQIATNLAVIGAGIAGCAATTFALSRGISTVKIGNTGALAYTSGYFDLLGVEQGKHVRDPWEGLNRLREREPDHPYSKICNEDIHQALNEFTRSISNMGLSYTSVAKHNITGLLPAGVCKQTACMPETMLKGGQAFADKARVLILDFEGLQGFSGREIVSNLSDQWPQLRTQKADFPDMDTSAQLFPEVLARALEVADTRMAFAEMIKPLIRDAEYVAMPAILGIHGSDHVHAEMETLLGVPVFEIPTIPPAVAGIRLRELFDQQLAERGATVINQHMVKTVSIDKDAIRLGFEDHFGPVIIEAENVLLASGRFLSGGLIAEQQRIGEPLMNLTVKQPEERNHWFSEAYFDPQGHPINRSGLVFNDNFQPLDSSGEVVDERLYAAGIVLSGQDWIRQRCGAGLAIATAGQVIKHIVAKAD